MGCNTSKESVQPAAEDSKDDVKNGGEVTYKYYFLVRVSLYFCALLACSFFI